VAAGRGADGRAVRGDDFGGGVIAGIEQVSALLSRHFPAGDGTRNADELPNRPVIVGR